MEIKLNRVMIFDGSFLLHRNLSQPNQWDMKNSKGKRTGGIYGVLRSILKELKDYNYYPVVVFDGGLSKRRLDIYPNYKRNLEKQLLYECKEEDLTEEQLLDLEFRREYNTQRNDLIKLLPLFGIPVIRYNNWEGDDIIYLLSKISKNSIVISDDKDLLQLIYEDENRKCRVRRPLQEEMWNINTLKEKNLDIEEYIGCKCIVGDPSDNIPSACFQVGDKTALGLYTIYKEVLDKGTAFPEDEETLELSCKRLNIPKRKAYLNFDKNQYFINFLLTNLEFVNEEIDETLINDIIIKILTDSFPLEQSYIPIINEYLNELEIKSFNIEELYNKVNSYQNLLKLEDYEKSQNVKEDNVNRFGIRGGLFK